MEDNTLIKLFQSSLKKYKDNILVWEKKDGKYRGTTYEEISHCVEEFSAGLMGLGLQKNDRVALISEGRKQWIVSELAVLHAGGISVPLSVKLNELEELKFRLSHSGCRFAVVSKANLHKLIAVEKELSELERIIVLDPVELLHEKLISADDHIHMGRKFLEERAGELHKRQREVCGEDIANICYTSGTTGDPKGIMLTHKNYATNIDQALELLPIPQWYSSLLILPWDHSFTHTVGIYILMKTGASISTLQYGSTSMETLKNIPVNIREAEPVFLLSVPSLVQNFKKNIEISIKNRGRFTELLFYFALKNAYLYNGLGHNRGRGGRRVFKPLHSICDRLVFKKIRSAFGGRLEFFIGGGSLLDIELQKFFYAIGIPIYQGYGLTEASPIISTNSPTRHKLGSSGRLVPGLEIKICDEIGTCLPPGSEGEIIIRGGNIMKGYWKNPDSTKSTLRDGWLYTGDLGYIDEDDFLYVVGRKKSLLIGNDGEKYSPEGIEEFLVSSIPFIDQIMLYNNQSPYTVALISLNKDLVNKYLCAGGISEAPEMEILTLLWDDLRRDSHGRSRADFPSRWLPSAFAILEDGFTEENKLLNTTMKMVRGKIISAHQERIDHLYTTEGKDIYNKINRDVLSKIISSLRDSPS